MEGRVLGEGIVSSVYVVGGEVALGLHRYYFIICIEVLETSIVWTRLLI